MTAIAKINLAEARNLRLNGWTLEAIGDRYGVSKEAVRQALMAPDERQAYVQRKLHLKKQKDILRAILKRRREGRRMTPFLMERIVREAKDDPKFERLVYDVWADVLKKLDIAVKEDK